LYENIISTAMIWQSPPVSPKEYKCKWSDSESVPSENNLNAILSNEEEDNSKEDD